MRIYTFFFFQEPEPPGRRSGEYPYPTKFFSVSTVQLVFLWESVDLRGEHSLAVEDMYTWITRPLAASQPHFEWHQFGWAPTGEYHHLYCIAI